MMPRNHQCHICKDIKPWSDDWRWYGSYKNLDDGKPVLKVCSDACAKGLSAPMLSRMLSILQQGGDPVVLRRARAD